MHGREYNSDEAGESSAFTTFRAWAHEQGCYIHPSLVFRKNGGGTGVYARESLGIHSKLVACPFDLAITPDVARERTLRCFKAESDISRGEGTFDAARYSQWPDRIWMCAYLIAHMIRDETGRHNSWPMLIHGQYIATMPHPAKLMATVVWDDTEVELLRGTNLYDATRKRQQELHKEWRECQKGFLTCFGNTLHSCCTWEQYLAASVYISSRAFPSSILDPTPSLDDESASPTLLPVIDCLNHARKVPVTWLVERSHTPRLLPVHSKQPIFSNRDDWIPAKDQHNWDIGIWCEYNVTRGNEVFNNYGSKSNAELLLGYGFALPNNPDDTILIQLGASSVKWEIGRKENPYTADAIEGLWNEALQRVLRDYHDNPDSDNSEYGSEETGGKKVKPRQGKESNTVPAPADARSSRVLEIDIEEFDEDTQVNLQLDTVEMLLEATEKKLQAIPSPLAAYEAGKARRDVEEFLAWYFEGGPRPRQEELRLIPARMPGQRSILLYLKTWLQNKERSMNDALFDPRRTAG